MNEMRASRLVFLLGSTVFATHSACASEATALILEAKIPLGEVAGRIDHLAYDPARQRLYVAELSNDSVAIVDLKAQRVLSTVNGFDEPQGIGYEPATDTIYVANGGDGSLRMFGGADFSQVGSIPLGADADNVRVDAPAHLAYVGYGSGAIAVIEPVSRKHIADIALKGHPESFQLDSPGTRIFINVPDEGLIEVASRETGKVIARWHMDDLRANYPLAIDHERGRILAVFRRPARIEAFDVHDGSRVGGVDTCSDADDIFIDAKRDLIYVICGQGTIDTYSPTDKTFERVGQVATSGGSRTGLFVKEADRLFVAIRASRAQPASIWVFRPAP